MDNRHRPPGSKGLYAIYKKAPGGLCITFGYLNKDKFYFRSGREKADLFAQINRMFQLSTSNKCLFRKPGTLTGNRPEDLSIVQEQYL